MIRTLILSIKGNNKISILLWKIKINNTLNQNSLSYLAFISIDGTRLFTHSLSLSTNSVSQIFDKFKITKFYI